MHTPCRPSRDATTRRKWQATRALALASTQVLRPSRTLRISFGSGEDELIDKVLQCWMSVWGQRVVSYRASRGMTAEPAIAVVVQRMVDSETSAVMFTADPASNDTSRIVIEAAFGLGEVVVSGQVEPDTYVLDKKGPRILSIRIGDKSHQIARAHDGKQVRIEIRGAERTRQVLTDRELMALGKLAIRIETHYGSPQDIEWASAGGQLYIVQSRPITTLAPSALSTTADSAAKVLVSGLAAAPGRVSGKVRVLRSLGKANSLQIRTNEFRMLRGGETYEPHEENPMIGYRGCFRYVKEPELFLLELDVLPPSYKRSPDPAPREPRE